MRRTVAVLLLVVLATASVQAGLLGKKKHKKHHSSTSTSTSTSTTTSTTSTERPETTEFYLDEDDEAENVLYLDNMDIIKIHLPLPVKHDYDSSDHTTQSVPDITPDTPPNPLPTATVPSHLPTAPSIIDNATGNKDTEDEEGTDDEDTEDEHTITEVPEVPEVPEIPEVPEDPEDEDEDEDEYEDLDVTTTSEPAAEPADADEVVIPDVATFDAVFANRSRLADDIRVFTFGGMYEIIVNRTKNSVEVVMVRHQTADKNETVPLREVTDPVERTGLQMMVRGPAVTGLETAQEEEEEGGEDDEQGHRDEHGDQNDDNASEHEDNNTKDDDEEVNKADNDSRHSKDQAQDDFNAVFINGSALSGVDVGVVSFNTSGTFRLNVSVSEDFMTVIISQLSEQIQKNGVAMPDSLAGFDAAGTPMRMRSAAPAGQDSASLMPMFTVLAVGAVATLFGAVVIWRARRRSRVNSFVRRGEDYGSVEHAEEAFDFNSFPQ